MELWIRTQDKEKLLIVKDVRIEKHFRNRIVETDLGQEVDMRNGEDIFYLLANKGTKIGEYKSKERALEVLDEIQNILKPQLLIRRNDNNDKVLLGALQKGVTQKIDMEYKELSTYVYEMPKE